MFFRNIWLLSTLFIIGINAEQIQRRIYRRSRPVMDVEGPIIEKPIRQAMWHDDYSPRHLGHQAYEALQELDTRRFQDILEMGVNRWKHNPQQFLEFINARGNDDWTPFMIAVVLDDPHRLKLILDAVEKVFGEDVANIAKVTNAQNKFGETPFFIAADFKNIYAVRFLLERMGLIFKNNKQLFFEFISTPETEDLWTAIMNMSFNTAPDGLHATVEKAAEVFGQDSPEYDQFINAENLYHEDALSLAVDDREIIYLKNHGAKMPSMEKDEAFRKQHEMGKKLLHIVKHSKAKKELVALLEEFSKRFPTDYNGYFHFLTMRDEAGWSAFMNAVADGNLEFVDIIYNAAKNYFRERPDWILYMFLTNDVHGRSPLHIAVTRKRYDMAEKLIKMYREQIKNDKRSYAQLMNYHSELTGFTPFLKAAYLSENDEFSRKMLILFLKNAEQVFGLNNAWFDHFINYKDLNGYTALTYIMVPTLRELLKRYGAKDPLDPLHPTEKFKKPEFSSIRAIST